MSAQLNSGAKLKITNGTDKIDRVAYRDLMFLLPYKKEHLREGIPYAPTFEDLIRLPTSQIDYILSIIAKNIRKNRKVGGEHFSNFSLKVIVDSWQRPIIYSDLSIIIGILYACTFFRLKRVFSSISSRI